MTISSRKRKYSHTAWLTAWLMRSPGNRWRLYKDGGWRTAESYSTGPLPCQRVTVTVPRGVTEYAMEAPATSGDNPRGTGHTGMASLAYGSAPA